MARIHRRVLVLRQLRRLAIARVQSSIPLISRLEQYPRTPAGRHLSPVMKADQGGFRETPRVAVALDPP